MRRDELRAAETALQQYDQASSTTTTRRAHARRSMRATARTRRRVSPPAGKRRAKRAFKVLRTSDTTVNLAKSRSPARRRSARSARRRSRVRAAAHCAPPRSSKKRAHGWRTRISNGCRGPRGPNDGGNSQGLAVAAAWRPERRESSRDFLQFGRVRNVAFFLDPPLHRADDSGRAGQPQSVPKSTRRAACRRAQ
jgi:hypothetical protein